ncbi:glycosyltransferase family 39 protein [Geothrix sp. PMB-07]|uniref:glycosyltransferase family 39 protein n=1 Tax=Geothrix sp. PMB-07 TaxID=3068640 RepID=UPI002740EEB7|nr:glycosyltransferase family 39 protein [Geothrix sp. PMB-07]WLT30603.1 glycosyltransferase family 39 protein [Geothrix sp. PMB-07]
MMLENPKGDMITEPSQSVCKQHHSVGRVIYLSPAILITLAIVVLTIAAYIQVVKFDFVTFDDPVYVTRNTSIQSGLSWKSIKYAFTSGDDGSYLPLVWLSHATCFSVFKMWAGGHHLVSLLLHVANSILLFGFLRRLTKSQWPSAGVAFLFALHPLHVESVAWVSERKDVLSTFFWILTSWAYLRYTDHANWRRYGLVLILFVLGLLSKSMLVTLPLTLLLFDAWPLGRIEWAGFRPIMKSKVFYKLVLEKIPLMILSCITALVTFVIQRRIGAMVEFGGWSLRARLFNAVMTIFKYLTQMVWPWNLSAFYPMSLANIPAWRVAGVVSFLLIVTLISIFQFRRRPYLIVGWLWYLITLLPVVGIVQVGGQAHADRYTYIPLIGVFIMICWLVEESIERLKIPRLLTLATGAAFMGTMLTLTAAQTAVWRDNVTLFKNALSMDVDNPVALINIGDEYLKRDQVQNAYAAYIKALKFSPTLYLSHYRVGYALDLLGRNDDALYYYNNASRLKPDFMGACQKHGHLLTRMGRYEEAAPFVERILHLPDVGGTGSDPVNPVTSQIDWAMILRSRDHRPEAMAILQGVLKRAPDSFEARLVLSRLLSESGYQMEALKQLESAPALTGRDPELLFRLGLAFLSMKRVDEAERAFNHLKEVNPQSPLLEQAFLELEKARHLN